MPVLRAVRDVAPFRVLLPALVVFLTVAPLANEGPYAVAITQVLVTALCGAVLVVLRGRPRKRTLTLFTLGTLALLWSAGTSPSRLQAGLTLVALLALHGVALAVVLRTLTATRDVSLDTVLGAAVGYLLIGLVFAFLFAVFAVWVPGSMPLGRGGGGDMPTLWQAGRTFPDIMYFSFSTLSSLGFEEMTPTNPFVRSISSLEAILGQLYLAVLVARLVGLHLAAETTAGRDPSHSAI